MTLYLPLTACLRFQQRKIYIIKMFINEISIMCENKWIRWRTRRMHSRRRQRGSQSVQFTALPFQINKNKKIWNAMNTLINDELLTRWHWFWIAKGEKRKWDLLLSIKLHITVYYDMWLFKWWHERTPVKYTLYEKNTTQECK